MTTLELVVVRYSQATSVAPLGAVELLFFLPTISPRCTPTPGGEESSSKTGVVLVEKKWWPARSSWDGGSVVGLFAKVGRGTLRKTEGSKDKRSGYVAARHVVL